MAWSASAIFQQAMINPMLNKLWTTTAPTTFGSLSADVIDCALFGTLTPDKTAAAASTGYNTGVWTTGNEMTSANYSAGGSALASKAFAIDSSSSSICFTAANVTWTPVTITNAYGDFVYDGTITGGTVTDQGLCYNYFGGAQSVAAGTFTIVWATVGATTAVFNVTV